MTTRAWLARSSSGSGDTLTGRLGLGLAGAVTVMVAGCSPAGPGETARDETHHRDGEGVLSVGGGDGGGLVFPAVRGETTPAATFGLFVMCTNDAAKVTLRDATWSLKGGGATVTPYVREIPVEASREPNLDYEPTVSIGIPESVSPPLGGQFGHVAGTEVRGTDCAHPAAPAQRRQDLVFVVTATSAGAQVDEISVHYSANGQDYAVDLGYTLVLCGAEVHDPDC